MKKITTKSSGGESSRFARLGRFSLNLKINTPTMGILFSAPSPDALSTLCTGKFSRLLRYLSGLSVSDLQHFSREEVVSLVSEEDKILMALFCDTRIAQIALPRPRRSQDPYASSIEWTNLALGNSSDPIARWKLVVRELAGVESPYPSLHKLDDVRALLRVLQLEEPEKVRHLSILDLSSGNLSDGDVKTLSEIVSLLPSLSVLRLFNNRFFGYYEKKRGEDPIDGLVTSLLKRDVVVDLSLNPFATADRKDFFQSLEEHLFTYLIWIPRDGVPDTSWKMMLAATDRPDWQRVLKTVAQTHEAYYSSN